MATLGDLMVRVGAEISGFSSAMRDVVAQASDAADAVAGKLESIGEAGQRLAVLGGILTGAITVPLEELARHSLDVAGTFEQTRIAFQSLMGSSTAAKDKLNELIKFAQDTPFEIPQVLDGARKLMALGFAAKDIVPILRIVGDQAAALGMGGVGMQRILMDLGKIEAQGKITGHELRNLGELDVPALASIALARHETPQQASKDVSEGKVDAEEAINAILRGMQLRTGGLMASLMSSFQAQMSNLKDKLTMTLDAIGQALLPVGKVFVSWASDAIEAVKQLAQWFSQLPGPVQGGVLAIASLVAGIGPALVALGGLGMAIPAISAGLTAIAGVFSISVAALLPWAVAIGAALVALTALGVWVFTHWAGIRAAVVQIWDGVGDLWNATLGVAVNWLVNLMGVSASDLKLIWTGFKSAFMAIWDSIASYVRGIWSDIKSGIIDPMMEFIGKIPGIQKIMSAGATFNKADHTAKERAEMDTVGKALRVGADDKPFAQTDAYQAALEKHNAKLKEAVELLAKFKKGHEDGIVSAKDFQQAQANVEFIRKDVPKHEPKAELGKTKVDRSALDSLSGEHANKEAELARQRAQIEHDFQMSKLGSAETTGMSPEAVAQQEIVAAEKRKAALDKLAEDERQKTLNNITDKLKLYKVDESGYAKLIEAKAAAENKFKAAVQKTTFDVESIKKASNEKVMQDDITSFNKDLAAMAEAQTRMAEAQKKHARDLATMAEETLKSQRQHAEAEMSMIDKQARFKLDTGEITKNASLRIKQEEADKLHEIELRELAEAQKILDMEYQMALLAVPPDRPDLALGINDEFQKRQIKLDSQKQQINDRHDAKTQDIGLEKQKDQFTAVFGPVQSGFAAAISSLIKGTQTFKQAWQSMSTSIIGSWINSMAQMASKWITHLAQMAMQWVMHKLGITVVHAAANQTMVASDAAASAQSRSISLTQHLHEVMLAAKTAGAKAFQSVVGIPVIGPILAPIAAAAAFVGVMAFSAEGGAVLPNHESMLLAHPQEMVLPKSISVGLQNLISSGGLSNAGSIMNQQQGGSMSSTALQMMRNTASAAGSGETHHNYHGPMHYHAAPGEAMTVNTFGKLFNSYIRENNLKMA